jgi:uncharacterized Zn ribbon protein
MKGQYGEECNITTCQKPNSAFWYNHFNHQYYCESCANRLNNDEFNKRDAQRLLGHDMCTYEGREGKAIVVGLDNLAEKELEAVIREQERGIIITPAIQTNNKSDSISNLINFKVQEAEEKLYNLRHEIQSTSLSGREKRRQRRKQQRKNK